MYPEPVPDEQGATLLGPLRGRADPSQLGFSSWGFYSVPLLLALILLCSYTLALFEYECLEPIFPRQLAERPRIPCRQKGPGLPQWCRFFTLAIFHSIVSCIVSCYASNHALVLLPGDGVGLKILSSCSKSPWLVFILEHIALDSVRVSHVIPVQISPDSSIVRVESGDWEVEVGFPLSQGKMHVFPWYNLPRATATYLLCMDDEPY